MMHYEAILFDLDNTLYDYTTYWRQRLRWSLEGVQAAYPRLDIAALVEQAIAERVYARHFFGFLQQMGVADEAICAAATERYHINDYQQLQLYEDTPVVLHTLRQQARLGLITNGPTHSQRPKIEQFDLAQWMDVLLISEEAGLAKPDPAIFHLALHQLAVPPQRALYVGDSLEHDLVGSHAAGIDFVWMNPANLALPATLPPPRARITRLRELLPLLGLA